MKKLFIKWGAPLTTILCLLFIVIDVYKYWPDSLPLWLNAIISLMILLTPVGLRIYYNNKKE